MSKKFIAAVLFLSVSGMTFAASKFGFEEATKRNPDATPLGHYQATSEMALFMCSMAYRMSKTLAESQSLGMEISEEKKESADYGACIRGYKPAIKTNYDGALSKVKKPAAKAALKEHYIQVIKSLEGIEPTSSERVFQYDGRQSENKVKRAEAWTRFEAEL